MIKKEDLEQYGKVEICEEKDGVFRVRITDGYDNKFENAMKIMDKINNSMPKNSTSIERLNTDDGYFDYCLNILKVSKKLKTKEEILDETFKKHGIIKDWTKESKDAVLSAMDSYSNLII